MVTNKATVALTLTLIAFFGLNGCAAEPATDSEPQTTIEQSDAQNSNDAGATPSTEPPANVAPDDTEAESRTQVETCDWDSPAIDGPATAPEGQTGVLEEVLVGSWQHTHTDDGPGFEATDNDHRYVFSAPNRLLYCQHVPGVTDHAQNAADITITGHTLELPGGKVTYTVTAWDDRTMVWHNPMGGGYDYLLQRR